ncbi:MAG: hypothetical protein N4A38_03310 [Candidatus Gracilibacteria bacterium]|nr:hypothetical protein [Candidatus Gracilibacteria bacterium]
MRLEQYSNNLKRRIMYYVYAIIILSVVLFFLLPQVFEIGAKKLDLAKTADEYHKIQKEGFSWEDFKAEIGQIETYRKKGILSKKVDELKKEAKKIYNQKLFDNLSENFYNLFFISRVGNYLDFLTKKQEELEAKILSDDVKERSESLNKILPFYGDKNLIGRDIEGEEKITGIYDDTDFILYIERLAEAFNLENKGDIGIANLISVDSDENYNLEKFSEIDNGIYSFDISLDLIGSKKDFLDFVTYIENVGNIEVIGDAIKINQNRYLKNRIPGDDEKNIFAHPIMEIKSIIMPDYLDNSLNLRGRSESFTNFVKRTKPREEFKAQVIVTFFVRGQPEYKKEQFIQLTNQKYKELKKLAVNQIAKLNSRNVIANLDQAVLFRKDAQKIFNYLNSITTQIQTDYKNYKKPGNINLMYNKFVDYAEVFKKLEGTLNDIQEGLNTANAGK